MSANAPPGPDRDVARLHDAIARCRVCAPHLSTPPRPVVQFSGRSRILIVGQAPGTKAHATGVPWQDPSGARLREWLGLDRERFYDPEIVATVPMGFCYPGKGASGDLPPRPECAPLWHPQVLALLPKDRLTLLVGRYAQARYLPGGPATPMAEAVRNFRGYGPDLIPLPHPSWRVVPWMKANPWFAEEVLPVLRAAVQDRLRAAA